MKGVLFCFLLALSPIPALGEERAGELYIDEIYLEPTYLTRETQGGDFSLGQSSFTLGWSYRDRYRAKISVGSLEERYLPQIYSSGLPDRGLGVIEGFAEYEGVYGRVRLGLLPLNFGHGGYQKNRDLVFPRPLIYENRIVARRDFGLSWYTSHQGYFTELIAHNGELDHATSDGNVWTTAHWGWTNDRNLRVQLSLQAGRSTSDSTATGSGGLAGFDKDQAAIWRLADLSVYWYPRKSEVILQSTYGEREQGAEQGSMNSHSLDVIRMFAKKWGFGFRYNIYDANRRQKDDGTTVASAALISGTEEQTSRVFLIYNRRTEEGNDVPSDDFRLVWRLIPWF